MLFDCSEIVRKSLDYEWKSGTMKDGRDLKYRIVPENSSSKYAISGISGNICIYFLNILVPYVLGIPVWWPGTRIAPT